MEFSPLVTAARASQGISQMSSWGIEELHKLCNRRNFSSPAAYTSSRQDRYWEATSHVERTSKVGSDLFDKTFNLHGQEYVEAELSYAAHDLIYVRTCLPSVPQGLDTTNVLAGACAISTVAPLVWHY